MKSDQGKINQVSFSPDGQNIATVATLNESVTESMVLTVTGEGEKVQESKTTDSVVQLRNLSGKQLAQLKGHQSNVLSVRLSSDGQRIATRAEDGRVRLWDISGRQLAELKGQGKINDVSFSRDGNRLASVGENGTVRLWEPSGKQLTEWKAAEVKLDYVSFSPDGQRLATAGADGTVRIWDLSGRKLTELRDHSSSIREVSFSPDGQQIATLDTTARIWDLSGRQIAEYQRALGFSPDGQYVAINVDLDLFSFNGRSDSVLLKHVKGLDELLAEGCDRLNDYFTRHPEALKELKVCQKR